jgi:hypothetical protein
VCSHNSKFGLFSNSKQTLGNVFMLSVFKMGEGIKKEKKNQKLGNSSALIVPG